MLILKTVHIRRESQCLVSTDDGKFEGNESQIKMVLFVLEKTIVYHLSHFEQCQKKLFIHLQLFNIIVTTRYINQQ